MLSANVSAQNTAITGNKFGDNWYLGINAGVATPSQKFYNKEYGFMKGMAPSFGLRVGKNLTTVFGLALDANVYFKSGEKSLLKRKTFINSMNIDLMGTFNLSNLFAGYNGEPRTFEIIALVGGGYSKSFGAAMETNEEWPRYGNSHPGGLNAKAALDFAFNLGQKKAWQLYIEPAVISGALSPVYANPFKRTVEDRDGKKKWNSVFQVSLGLNYKFGTSNGTHNFAKVALRDQAEIDALNAQINDARRSCDEKCASKDAEIARLKKALQDCENRPAKVIEKKSETATNLQPTVLFRQGKSVIDAAQYAPIELIATYMKNHPDVKVEIKGYASPEGSKEFNQKLSEKRAEVVKKALVKKYKIAADRLTTKGMGATDKLFEQVEFNRVATFHDTTK